MASWMVPDKVDLFDFISTISKKGALISEDIDAAAAELKRVDGRKDSSQIFYSLSAVSKFPKLGSARFYVEQMEAAGYVFQRNEKNTTRPYQLSLKDVRAIYSFKGEPPFSEGRNTPAVCVAVNGLKGGTGKSTAATNICSGLLHAIPLIRHQLRVCVIDLDPQGSQGYSLGVDAVRKESAFQAMMDDPGKEVVQSWVKRTITEGLDILPASTGDAFLIRQLQGVAISRNRPLTSLLYDCVVRHLEDSYDLIMLDTPPHLDEVMLNVLACSNGIMVTTSPDPIDLDSTAKYFEGMESLFMPIPESRLQPQLFKILLTRYDKNNSAHDEAKIYLLDIFPRQLMSTVIPYALPFKTSQASRESIFEIPIKDYNGDGKSLDKSLTAMTAVCEEFFKVFLLEGRVKS